MKIIMVVLSLGASIGLAQSVAFTSFPKAMQFFARDGLDSATVTIAGTVTETGHDSVFATVRNGDTLRARVSVPLVYGQNGAPFLLSVRLHAELSLYRIQAGLDSAAVSTASGVVCGDAYLVEGQSNAVCYGASTSYQSAFIRSFGTSATLATGATGCFGDTAWGLAQASSMNSHCAVGVWPMRVARHIVDSCRVPVCLINGAVNGTEIEWHLRPANYKTNVTAIYGRLYYRARKAGLLNAVKGLMWYQGETHSEPSYLDWGSDFDTLYRSWKEDFPALRKCYVFQIRHGCVGVHHDAVREAQRKLASLYPDVSVLSTFGVPGHDGCHYSATGYERLGDDLYRLVARDFYGSVDTAAIEAPDVQRVFFADSQHRQLVVEFNQPVSWPADYSGKDMKDYFYPAGLSGRVDSGRAEGNRVTLFLNAASSAGTLTYLPNLYYNGTSELFQGPYIANERGLCALSFMDFPIGGETVSEHRQESCHDSFTATPNPFNPVVVMGPAVAVSIVDVKGALCEKLTSNSNRFTWNAGGRPAGVYLACVRKDSGKMLYKRIVLAK